ncbi:lactate utilization protein C [Lactococcus formosensis]|jgi:L-lactate dehydrogenase complex protein LldG|uniref:Lactate utilization protein C n=1 Tax=Lactococcus formosensis TaxID=1281486 RepID=A0A9Q8Y0T9_9LACT|nr:lactate utilization protein C [Lactococcus formosensis]MDG6111203.1 lactate utilization protein C [Lactococcus formosensis]MDG6117189.1 lactate utilization protein C [Lactococcus formosensis]MDG6132646.1 lactate utilization protein C [Lactococcus formosensis]MDG6134641.1 lactate utilization protein C [Lactococcus formosensis]MDG6137653.1 lactate utilization protein C [Lactococcus formosensis]
MTGTIENRTQFLDTLLKKRGGVELPFEPYTPISDLPQTHLADLSTDELLELAKEQARRVSANIVETTSSQMNEIIQGLIEKSGGGQVIVPSTDELEKLGVNIISDQLVKWKIGKEKREENINAAQNSNVVVAVPKFFLAESATIVVESEAGQGRSLHFLPTHYISVIPLSRMVPRSTQATTWLDENKKPGSTLHFISGPSNSGDIEMQLVVGLHGPLEINYVIVKDL